MASRAPALQAEVERARYDYENEYIGSYEYKRIRDRESTALTSNTDLVESSTPRTL